VLVKLKNIPVIGPILSGLASKIHHKFYFKNSSDYWEKRYKDGGNSGSGSYNQLAVFKAEILNTFVKENKITSVVELGCGDANQLKLLKYPKYKGYDVSNTILKTCSKTFANDESKQFDHISNFTFQKTDLILSLDVIYHLVENVVFEDHMKKLFDVNNKNVIIYSSNFDNNFDNKEIKHVRHRKFTNWVEKNAKDFKLDKFIKNKHPFKGDRTKGSLADFYFYSKI
jgi:hypothetical protein